MNLTDAPHGEVLRAENVCVCAACEAQRDLIRRKVAAFDWLASEMENTSPEKHLEYLEKYMVDDTRVEVRVVFHQTPIFRNYWWEALKASGERVDISKTYFQDLAVAKANARRRLLAQRNIRIVFARKIIVDEALP